MHHSELGGRKINVEVTCGGGGKGKNRERKLENKKRKFMQARRKKSSQLRTETDHIETKSVSKISAQTDNKQTCNVSQSTSELHSEKIRDKTGKRTDFIKGVGKGKNGKDGGDMGKKWLKQKHHSTVADGRKRKLNDQSSRGFHKRSKNKVSQQDV